MAAPSELSKVTSPVDRLLKEEASYHKEQSQQEERIKRLEEELKDHATQGENAEFQLKQEKQALDETKKVIPSVRHKIMIASTKLEKQLDQIDDSTSAEEVSAAKAVLKKAQALKD